MTNHPATTAFSSQSGFGVIRVFAATLLLGLLLPVFLLQAEPAQKPNQLKLVVLAPDLVELLYSLDAGSQIIAASEHADHPEAAKALPRVGNYAGLSLEKIVSLQPDLILYWQSGTPAADIQRLKQLGFAVESFESKSLDDIASHLLRLGAITGRNAKAVELVADFRHKLNQLKTQYQHKTAVPVFYEIWDTPLSMSAPVRGLRNTLRFAVQKNVIQDPTNPYPQAQR